MEIKKHRERVSLNDTAQSAITKLAEGNAGALCVLCETFERGQQIDPDNFAGGFGGILALDAVGIYGSRIWRLYKDCCGQSIERTLAALRAVQLGLVARETVLEATEAGTEMDWVSLVRANIPNFAVDYWASMQSANAGKSLPVSTVDESAKQETEAGKGA